MPVVGGAVLEMLSRQFHGTFRSFTDTNVIGVVSELIAGGDAERVFLAIVNLGVNDSFLSPTPPAAATAGIRLGNGGGLIAFSAPEDGLLPAIPWYCVAPVGNSAHYILSVRRDTRDPTSEGE